LAFSPLLGLHTFLGLTISFVFGLNRVALLLGLYVNNPWTLIPIYAAAAYVGGIVVGFPARLYLPHFSWSQLWNPNFWLALAEQWRVLMPIVVGSVILSILVAIISYPLALYFLKQGRAHTSFADSTRLR